MPDRTPRPRARSRRAAATLAAAIVALVTTVVVVVAPTPAGAAGTVLFQNLFNDRTVDGTGTVTLPAPSSGTNVACLTASGNTSTGPLLSCAGAPDAQGTGKLRLTNSTVNQVGGVFGSTSFPTSNGLDVTFNSYQWGGGSADGISFALAAVDPANPVAPTTLGPAGGSLGYSTAPGVNGLSNAYLGVGLDVYGNFSSTMSTGTGCTNAANITSQQPGAVVVRGPGTAKAGYCGLATTSDGTTGSKLTLRASTRAASVVPVQVLINPTGAAFTSDSGVSVAAGTYKVVVTPVGQATKTLTGPLPSVAAGMYPSTTWLNTNGVPRQMAFGFVGSTGSVTDVHEISNVKVLTFNPVPQLAVATTSFSAATSQAGDPVTYRVTPSVLAGANETAPISVTQTVPAGVVPVGAFGSGWTCAAPSGPSVSCTTTASSFTNGTTLPPITVVAIATGAITAAVVQSTSSTTVSSSDANPGTDTAMTAGSLPAAPTGIAVTPTSGTIADGGAMTITGSNIIAASAIEIGTTAQQQSGTPVTLLPCPGAAAVGCFTVSGSSLVISSIPARTTAAPVTFTVVTAGIAGSASYVYTDKPGTPATPTAVAVATSATVTWAAPADNGATITGYSVVPYRNGVAQAAVSFDASTTTRSLTGLTVGASYTFTVAAVNALGTSAASPKSAAVVPYTVPGAPAITAVTAGTGSATLSWTAPANTGSSPITGYVITPYILDVAQPPRSSSSTATTQTVSGLTPGTAYTFTVTAVNAAGPGPSSSRSGAVTPNVSPSLTFAAPPAGEVGVAYSRTLTVTDGTAPFAWSVSAGALPAGLTLGSSTGILSGTPTASGSFPVTIQVVDASGQSATRAITLVVAAAPSLAFTAPPGEVAVAFSQQPALTGGTGPFVWSVSAGSLPPGLTMNASTGLISGTPTTAGSSTAVIAVTDAFNQVATKSVSFVIVALPAFTFASPLNAKVGVAASTTLDVSGGTLPLTWSIAAGNLPPGLTLSATTGLVSGTPTTAGSTTFTASVVDANGKVATKAATFVVAAGPLVIAKTASVSSAAPGATVGYTVTITNTGASTWSGATLSDPLGGVLDDATYNANATATSGTVTYTAPTLGWTGNIAAGATVTITYSVTVNNPDAGNKVLTGTVTSSTLGTNCATGSGDARCSSTVTVPGLSIVASTDAATATPGATVRVTVVVTNNGQTPYPAASLTTSLAGILDDATYNADATSTSGNVSYTNPTLSWTGSLAVGASATITYSATVTNPDLGNKNLSATVISPSAGSPCPSTGPSPSCSFSVTVLIPALAIATRADASTTTPGSMVRYTLTIANTGQTSYTGATATLALAGALDDAGYAGDASATSGTVAFDAGTATLTWTGNLAIGATATVTASVTVKDPDPGNLSLTTIASSPAPGTTCPAGTTNPVCSTSVSVRVPELTVSTSADAMTTTPGSIVRYTVRATNTGQTAYVGTTIVASLGGVLDDATYNGDATAATGSVSFSAPTLTWTGDLAIGATATTTFTVTVAQPDAGDHHLVAVARSAAAGSTCPLAATAPSCTSTVEVLIPGLHIESAVDATTTTPGSVITYTVTVTNTGETDYRGLAVTVDMLGALDDATYNNDATTTTGSLVTGADGTAAWVLDLAVGQQATGRMSLTVNSPAVGDRSLRTVVVADAPGSNCATGSPEATCGNDVTVLVPGLTITKTADTATTTPGGVVTYTITVVNSGETQAAANLTDDLSIVLRDAVYAGDATASTGTVRYDAPVLGWSAPLAPGASATITYSVTVRDPDPGDKSLLNVAVSTTAGSNCPAGSSDPRCRAAVTVLVPGFTLVTTADQPTTTPGATVTYTVAATNTGATPLTGATFTDALSDILDDATYNGDAVTTSGSVSYTAPTLTWSGDLAIGASATTTFSVTIHAADDGDDLPANAVTSSTAGSTCPTGGSDPRCRVTVPVARLILAYGAIDPTTTPGSTVRIVATYTNTGQVPYTGIVVTSDGTEAADDVLPGGDQTASSGSLVLGTTGITWKGDIPIGGIVDLGASMVVKNPDDGNRLIGAVTESTAPGSNCPAGGTDPRCSMRISVLIPELTITKAANTPATVAGGTVAYTITVHNTGETAFTAATFTDPLSGVLDDATYDVNAAASIGTVSFSSSTLSWTGDLAVGATAVVTYSVTARSPAPGDKTMVNQVSSPSVGSTCPPASGNAACRSTVVVLTPRLTVTKTADVHTATLGSAVTYRITVANTGQTSYTTAALSDDLTDVLEDATYGEDAVATSGTVGLVGSSLNWSGALSPGASATITYTATINPTDQVDATMVNTVVSPNVGSNCPTGSADPRCTATVTLTDATSLTFTKTADAPATTAGAVVTYTITILNSSESDLEDVDLTDPLAGILDDASYNDDAVATAGTISSTGPDLVWSGTVPTLGTVAITYSVTVDATPTGDQVLTGTVSSNSEPNSDNCLVDSVDPRCTSTVLVAALAIQQHYRETSTTPGSLVHLSATFTNTGAMPYVGITISSPSAQTIDDAIPTGDQSATAGTLSLSATAITWTGSIPVGATVTVTGTLTVKNPDTGDRLLTGTLVSAALGSTCPPGGTDPACTASLPVLLPGLTVTKSADTTAVVPGMAAGYTITITNSGETPYVGASVTDALTGVLDDATYTGDAAASSGTVSYASPTLTWTGDLAVGATATVTYTVDVNDPAIGDKVLVNAVVSTTVGSTCPPASGNPACRTTIAELTPALTITSTADVATSVPGASVTFTVTATNTGQTPYVGATFAVAMGSLLDDAAYDGNATASAGSVSFTSPTLTWTGDLSYGASATVTYSVTINDPDTGNFRLDQTVTSTTQGSTCAAGSPDNRCSTSVPIASMRILNTADVTTAQPTSVVTYTGTFTNTGQVPYVGISISDSFVGALDDATYNGDAGVVSGGGSLVLVTGTGRVTWTGDLAVGATVVISGSLTVNNPASGNRTMSTVITTSAAATNCSTGSADPACRSSVSILIPALTVTTTADTTTATPGSVVAYTMTITDSGQTDYPSATVTNTLGGVLDDAEVTSGPNATSGAVTVSGPTLSWSGSLTVGQTVVVTYALTVDDPDQGDKLMVDRITADAIGSTCPVGPGSGPGCVSFVQVLVPALDIAIAADATTATPGSTVGYTVTLRNIGQTGYVGAPVTVALAGVLDDATYGGDARATTGATNLAGEDLSWTGDIAIGATVTITYSVTVREPDAGNRLLQTSVSSPVSGGSCRDASPCVSTVTVLVPGLSVSTSASATTTTPGSLVTFTIVLTNTGDTPYTGTLVRTDLSEILDDAAVVGTPGATIGVVTYTEPELSWTGTLHEGDIATITYVVSVLDPDPGDQLLRATLVAEAAGSTCPAADPDADCTATVSVLIPELAMSLTADAATTTPGSVLTYTIVLTNTGQTDYVGAEVLSNLSGVLADAAYGDDGVVIAGGGVLDYTEPTLRWTGDLAIGATATIRYSITIDDPDTGDKDLVSTVVSDVPGSGCPAGSTDAACTAQVRVLVPGLTITKVADTSTVAAGSVVSYTVTVANTGETAYVPATFTDPLTGVLDDATYDADAEATLGSVDDRTDTLVWTGALEPGDTATITYSVTTTFPATGDRILTNAAHSALPGSNCAGDTDVRCESAVTVLIPALEITTTTDAGEVVAGGALRYTVVATNTGEADYPTATITDSLADVLDDAELADGPTATHGTATVTDEAISWVGALGTGDTVTITYSVIADLDDLGDAILTNHVSSDATGSTCAPDAPLGPCSTSTPVAARSITLSGVTPSFTLSGLPHTTVTADGAVTMTVTTNSSGGYVVSARALSPSLTGSTPGNSTTIPIDQLRVRESGTSPFQALSDADPRVVHQQRGPSSPGGDAVSNDYQVDIPFVAPDTYSGTIEYIVSAT